MLKVFQLGLTYLNCVSLVGKLITELVLVGVDEAYLVQVRFSDDVDINFLLNSYIVLFHFDQKVVM